MKFGRQFEFYKIPEWSEFYFDYKGIKTVIKFLDKRRVKKKQLKKIKILKARLRRLSTQLIPQKNLEEIINNTNNKDADKETESNLNQSSDNIIRKIFKDI